MDKKFVDILKKLILEQGKEALLSACDKRKGLLDDYTGSEFKKEKELLLKVLEIGVQKAIDTTEELEVCKQQQVRVLREKLFMAEELAVDVVDTLVLVLRGEQESETSQDTVCTNCGKELQKEWKVCPYCSTQVAKTETPLDVVRKKPAKKKKVRIEAPLDVTGSGSNLKKANEFCDRAMSYFVNGDFDNAITQINEAIRLVPNTSHFYVLRGNFYIKKGQYDMAIRDLDNAIRLDPNSAFAYRLRGEVYGLKDQYDMAIRDLDNAIKLDPNTTTFYGIRGHFYIQKGQYDMAIRDLDNAIRLEPNNAFAYRSRGKAYLNIGQYDKALRDLDNAIGLDPNDAFAYRSRGELYLILGQYDRALSDLGNAIYHDSNDAVTYGIYGQTLCAMGEINQGIDALEYALSLDPTLNWVRQELQKIREYLGR